MIQFSELPTVPFIGQIVHYHPNEHTRLAAIVIEVHPIQRDDGGTLIRPNVDLQICNLNGKLEFKQCVETFTDDSFSGSWAFQNEMQLKFKNQPDDDEELLGSQANHHMM